MHIFLKKLFCYLIGHNLKRSKKITNHIDEYQCIRCRLEFTNNREGSIVKTTKNLKERNEVLSKMHSNRISSNKK